MGAASKPEALAPRSRVTEIVMEIENDAEHFPVPAAEGKFDGGKLTCFVDAVVPFALASDAYCGKVKGRRGRSKLAVAIP
jgi:hypothetical protein